MSPLRNEEMFAPRFDVHERQQVWAATLEETSEARISDCSAGLANFARVTPQSGCIIILPGVGRNLFPEKKALV